VAPLFGVDSLSTAWAKTGDTDNNPIAAMPMKSLFNMSVPWEF
jgi:hypothetical protein